MKKFMLKRVVPFTANTLMVLGFVGMALYAVWAWSATPTVQVSATSGECRKVESIGGGYSCYEMPEKYEVVWVK